MGKNKIKPDISKMRREEDGRGSEGGTREGEQSMWRSIVIKLGESKGGIQRGYKLRHTSVEDTILKTVVGDHALLLSPFQRYCSHRLSGDMQGIQISLVNYLNHQLMDCQITKFTTLSPQ